MKLIRSLSSPDLPANGCALTIGNFDAVHMGHRKILQTLVAQAKQRNLPAMVMTFDPHPQEYFSRLVHASNSPTKNSAQPHARLTTTSARFFALRECGVDLMLSLKFNRELSRTSADRFIRDCLAGALKVKYLLVGDDFRFGQKRVGDFKLLEQMAQQCGYEVARIDTMKQHAQRISSSWIRELLARGELEQAEQLLGRKYAHTGRVIHGDQRGRQWGFPTVNLAIRHKPALAGVFAVTVSGLAERDLAGVASLGKRPTVRATSSTPTNVLEVYLFDYHGDAYGRRICVEFVKKIRDEEKFSSYEQLIQQIGNDVRIAKQMLSDHGKSE